MLRRLIVPLAVILALSVAACGSGDEAGDGITVVATTTIWGDVARNVVGDGGTVEVLMPIGADPHDYQASSQQVAAMQTADLVVANGLGLEEGLETALDAVAADGGNVLEIGERLDPLPFEVALGHEDGREGEDEHEHGDDDPHLWMDPLRMAEGARIIAAELAALDPEGDWTARAEAYAAELEAADESIIATLDTVPDDRRKLVTNHGSMGYFADRYGFTVIGVVIPGGSSLGDPSSAELAELVETMRAEGVNAVFAETTQPSALAEAVAAELGDEVEVIGLYTGSLGEPDSGADTLIGMLTTNARLVAEALQ